MPEERLTQIIEMRGMDKKHGVWKRAHTHIGSAWDKILYGRRCVILNGVLYGNARPVGKIGEDDETPDGKNNGIDYLLNKIPVKNLSTLGFYIKTAFEQSQRLKEKKT